jgi:hypothetical protein
LEPLSVTVAEGDAAEAAEEETAEDGDLVVVAGVVGVPDCKMLQAGLHQNVNHNVPLLARQLGVARLMGRVFSHGSLGSWL